MAARQMKPTAVVSIDPGAGNLSSKAYIASVVGPLRSVFGKNTSAELNEGNPTQLVRNAPASNQWAYVTVLLPGNIAGPKVALFSSNGSIGFNSSLPVSLQRTMGSPAGNAFASVLAPGDMVYAQAGPGQGTFKVVVSVVWF